LPPGVGRGVSEVQSLELTPACQDKCESLSFDPTATVSATGCLEAVHAWRRRWPRRETARLADEAACPDKQAVVAERSPMLRGLRVAAIGGEGDGVLRVVQERPGSGMASTVAAPGNDLPRDVRSSRRRIWQVPAHLHCSVIGTCLSLEELRQISAKVGLKPQPPVTDHALHGALVQAVADRQGAGRVVQRHLDRKYAECIRRFTSAQDEVQLAELWRQVVAEGDLAAGYWTLLTHPRVTMTLGQQAFGEVHMLSHVAATALRKVRVELGDARERLRFGEQELAALRTALGESSETVAVLEDRLARALDQVTRAARLPAPVVAAEDSSDDCSERTLASQLATARAAARRARHVARERRLRLAAAEAKCDALALALAESERQRGELQEALARWREGLPPVSARPAPVNGQAIDLEGRWVAYVGGRNHLAPRLRAITERHNGQFLHHDGGLHENPARLEAVIERADLVMCPLDCVSHGACEQLKRHCKRRGKPFLLLRSSSVSAFANGLREAASR